MGHYDYMESAKGAEVTRTAFYKTNAGQILCDPCSVKVCVSDQSIAMHRTYGTQSPASFPALTCEMCGERHTVKQ